MSASASKKKVRRAARCRQGGGLPQLLIADEVAELLRTTRAAVYALVARGQLPGVICIGRRVLFSRRHLLDWLDQNRAPSPKGE